MHRPAGHLAGAVALHTAVTALAGVLLRRRARLDAGWFVVSGREHRWHRYLGVGLFRRVLRAVGWDGVVGRVRRFDGTRAGLAVLDRHTRLSEASHLAGVAAGVAAALVALAAGRPASAARRLALALVLHTHPVLLQRAVRARIARLGRR